MVQELAAEVAAEAIRHAQRKLENFNAKTLEYEEELKANNKECKESLRRKLGSMRSDMAILQRMPRDTEHSKLRLMRWSST